MRRNSTKFDERLARLLCASVDLEVFRSDSLTYADFRDRLCKYHVATSMADHRGLLLEQLYSQHLYCEKWNASKRSTQFVFSAFASLPWPGFGHAASPRFYYWARSHEGTSFVQEAVVHVGQFGFQLSFSTAARASVRFVLSGSKLAR